MKLHLIARYFRDISNNNDNNNSYQLLHKIIMAAVVKLLTTKSEDESPPWEGFCLFSCCQCQATCLVSEFLPFSLFLISFKSLDWMVRCFLAGVSSILLLISTWCGVVAWVACTVFIKCTFDLIAPHWLHFWPLTLKHELTICPCLQFF